MSAFDTGYALGGLNVLVVDDNRHMVRLISSILHALGVRNVCEANDAAEALEHLKSFSADIIIVDWQMQPLDGLDFTRLVRTGKDSPNRYVPIIMLSAFTEMSLVTKARDAGINEFLAKPVSPKALYSRMASLIDNPRSFVRTDTYFGPDRRRKDVGPPRGVIERRKTKNEDIDAQTTSPDAN